ncbi:MAG: NAD-dependent epimerase/dehydratase family protein [Brooklawnia sp.]|nr:NAD-dependent epimerase/dehydratase family protein [Brooklawnia sp.]
MRNVLITGQHSYLGNSLREWLSTRPDAYRVDMLDLKDPAWHEAALGEYDSVVHMAGIAHVSADPSLANQYYRVNRDLTIETARKAKADGVRQFIFISSMKVYGGGGAATVIDRNTVPSPDDDYGRSKLEAEHALTRLCANDFAVALVRPPMVYGAGSRGNYPRLARFATKTPLFPDFDNARSMIHVDNLSEFLRLLIDDRAAGVYCPQNQEFVKTSDLVRMIAEVHGRRIRTTRVLNPLISALLGLPVVNKVFGDYTYDLAMSEYEKGYRVRDFRTSIALTESLP